MPRNHASDRPRRIGILTGGGDGTLSFARRLDEEGVPVIAVPKVRDISGLPMFLPSRVDLQ